MNSKHLPYWLAANDLGIAPQKFLHLLANFSDIEHLFSAGSEELKAMGATPKVIPAIQNPQWQTIEKTLKWTDSPDQHIVVFSDPDYPELLKEISDPPLLLFLRGNKNALQHTQLAIVGARHATLTGIKNAEQFAYALAQAGLTITSGLAIGIDGASHRGALKAKGSTIGVAGTGLNIIYPKMHRELMDEIVSTQGAVISEFPLDTPARPQNFPRRNRIIAGLSRGVLIVEAALKSGSLITARLALEEGREIFALPGSIHHPLMKGCHYLIRQGAKLVECASDILEELKLTCDDFRTTDKIQKKSFAHLEKQSQRIFDEIHYELTTIDVILLRTGLTPSEVSSILLALEIDGYIQSVPGGYIRS